MAAAMAVAALALPRGRGPAETGFLTADLTSDPGVDTTPRVEFSTRADGALVMRRFGLEGLTAGATVALAVTRKGFDLTIEERVTPTPSSAGATLDSEPPAAVVNCATFILPGLSSERYHLKYNSDPTSSFCTLAWRNLPGFTASRVMG